MARDLPPEDPLIRMQRDLKRANAEKPQGHQVGHGHRHCQMHRLPCLHHWLRGGKQTAAGGGLPGRAGRGDRDVPLVGRRFVPRPCVHCQNPPCVKVCPVTATYKNEQGVVVVNYNRCIGCRYCLVACPYAARTSDFGEWYTDKTPEAAGKAGGRKAAGNGYEAHPQRNTGKSGLIAAGSPVGNARKCHFCLHRLAVGMLPACVTTCVGRATIFGDRTDPESLVYEQIGSPRVFRLKEELGTQPSVYYLK